MKKILSILFLGVFLFTLSLPALAENFTYKVYNPRTNKVYTGVLGTISITDNEYIWGFYTKNGIPLCVAQIYNTNKENGLVGGNGTDINAFIRFLSGEKVDLSQYNIGWRELSQNTLYAEMNSIRKERTSQGKTEYRGFNK